MKKILSVALSTAMAFSMFASVAFGADAAATTPDQKFDALKTAGIVNGLPDGLAHLEKTLTRAELAKIITKSLGLKEVTGVYTYKDNNYGPNHWAAPFIEAVTAAGIMQGSTTNGKQFFNPNGNVTAQELAIVLTRALKLEVPTETTNNAATWAKGEVQAAINKGLLDANTTWTANATRSQAVVAAYAIWEAAQVPTVASYKVVDASNVEFTLSTGEVVKVKLDKALVAKTETPVEFKDAAGHTISTKVTWDVTDATKVASVSANNLREVTVEFDGEVDATTAEDASNYTLTGARNPEVLNASLSSDKKTVTLTVEGTGTDNGKGLTNQSEYQLDVTNVRAGSTVINATDVKFTPVDAALPVANTAEALGNKAIKVTFSEPIVSTDVTANNFKVDGNSVVGTIDVSGKTVVLKLYSALTTGEHTVNVSGIKDYSGLSSLSTDLKVNVVEDTTAPTVSVEKSTFEQTTLTFSEPVDKSTVNAGNIYWMEGTTKHYATSVEANSDTSYTVTFTGSNVFKYPTSLYVVNVADYSGNVIAANTTVSVSPVVDQTRPEVVSVKFADNSNTDFDVKFTKSLQASSISGDDFVIKKADGTVVSSFKSTELASDNKTVHVHLYTGLSAGTAYTLEVANIADATTLHNVMLPYSTTVTLGDTTPPKLDSVAESTTAQRVVVTFNEAMATSGDGSILEKSHYIYYKGGTVTDGVYTGGAWTALPAGASIIASSDAKSAIIIFPTSVAIADVNAIRVTGVKDVAGNTLENLVAERIVAPASQISVSKVAATATNTIKVSFGQTIQNGSAAPSDFVVKTDETNPTQLTVVSASVDGSDVYLTLSDATKLNAKGQYGDKAVVVDVLKNRNLVTPSGTKVANDITGQAVVDNIKPAISSVSEQTTGSTVTVTFTEAVTLGTNGQYDFEVLADGDTLTLGDDYTVTQTAAGTTATITLTAEAYADYKGTVLQVRVKPYPSFIKDAAGNVVAGGSDFFSSFISAN